MASYLSNLYKANICKISKVYLCVKPRDKMEYFSMDHNCIKFDTYEEAYKYYKTNIDKNKIEYSTMMPVCKFVPEFLHPSILNYKLSKLFINAHISKRDD
jgi:hypothetical protein